MGCVNSSCLKDENDAVVQSRETTTRMETDAVSETLDVDVHAAEVPSVASENASAASDPKDIDIRICATELEPEPQPVQIELEQTPPMERPNYSEDQPIVSKYILEERQREESFRAQLEAERKFKEELWQAELVAAAAERNLCTTTG